MMCRNCGMENALLTDMNCWHCHKPLLRKVGQISDRTTKTPPPGSLQPDCSARTVEDDLRLKLYKAATEYGKYILGDEIDYDKAMRVADELEAAAEAFAERAPNDRTEPPAN
jgi:hypothetical protein